MNLFLSHVSCRVTLELLVTQAVPESLVSQERGESVETQERMDNLALRYVTWRRTIKKLHQILQYCST